MAVSGQYTSKMLFQNVCKEQVELLVNMCSKQIHSQVYYDTKNRWCMPV